MTNLKNHIAIISGGLGDIGRSIALELGRRGASIGVSDIREARDAEPLLKALRANRKSSTSRIF